MSDYYRCGRCEEVYKEGDEDVKTVSGRVGHIDNWLPDQSYAYCPHCGTNVEDAGADEVTVEELLEEIEYLGDAKFKEIDALHKEVNLWKSRALEMDWGVEDKVFKELREEQAKAEGGEGEDR